MASVMVGAQHRGRNLDRLHFVRHRLAMPFFVGARAACACGDQALPTILGVSASDGPRSRRRRRC
jgi:hypothetical protein